MEQKRLIFKHNFTFFGSIPDVPYLEETSETTAYYLAVMC